MMFISFPNLLDFIQVNKTEIVLIVLQTYTHVQRHVDGGERERKGDLGAGHTS